jgi:hypothetical protein
MAGNVWDWTSGWYGPDRARGPCCASDTYDPQQPQFKIQRKVIKVGSFVCADSYCLRYRPAARQTQDSRYGMSHNGFRCVLRRSHSRVRCWISPPSPEGSNLLWRNAVNPRGPEAHETGTAA